MFNYYKQYGDNIYYISFVPRQNNLALSKLRFTGSLGIISVNQLKENLNQPSSSSLSYIGGPYPIAVRYMNNGVYAVERPPFQIKVDYTPTRSNQARRPIKPVEIWIPWTVTFYDLSSDQSSLVQNYAIYFNDGPLQSYDDVLIQAYTSNVYGNGRICLGASGSALYSSLMNKEIPDLATLHNKMFNDYFSGGWNSDLTSNILYSFPSLEDPLVIKDYSNIDPSSEIAMRAKKANLRFSRSYHESYRTANIYYNLSLLDLQETLSIVNQLKQRKHDYYNANYTFSKIIETGYSSNKSSSNIVDATDNYSSNPCLVELTIENPNQDQTLDTYNSSHFLPEEIKDFINSNLDTIMDQVYNDYNKDKNSLLALNYQIPDLSNAGVSDEPF